MVFAFRRSIKQGGFDLNGPAFNGSLNGVEAAWGGFWVSLSVSSERGREGDER